MHQIKGTNSSGLVIPELNIKSCTSSRWAGHSGIWQQRSTQYDRNYWIAGGWFRPSLTETKSANIAVEDYDQTYAAGYSAIRFTAYPIGSNAGYSHVYFETYRSGGQESNTISLPASDPDQWFHFMAAWAGVTDTIEFWVNGKYLSTLKWQDPPYPTSQNRSNSNWTNPVMSRRYAGSWQNAQTYSGAVYSYFLMDLSEFKGNSDFQNMGMDPNDKKTYYKPWMKMDSELIVPITDEDSPGRKDNIKTTNRGLYITVEQGKNDVKPYYDTSTYTGGQYGKGEDSDYFKQPVYGYTL